MTLSNFPDLQVETSFCSDASGVNYWLFSLYRGNENPRIYRLPEFPCDWSGETWRNQLEDRKPLLSIVQSRTVATHGRIVTACV
jgi:hypothetical protein